MFVSSPPPPLPPLSLLFSLSQIVRAPLHVRTAGEGAVPGRARSLTSHAGSYEPYSYSGGLRVLEHCSRALTLVSRRRLFRPLGKKSVRAMHLLIQPLCVSLS